MLYHRFYGLEPDGPLVRFEDTPRTASTTACDAATLRARAAHCRSLAETFYDQNIVAELESYARELDGEAAALDRSKRDPERQTEVTVLPCKGVPAGRNRR